MFNATWKTLRTAPVVKCFHKARIVPSEDKCENETGSGSGTSMGQNWQQLCKALRIMFRQHMVTLLVL